MPVQSPPLLLRHLDLARGRLEEAVNQAIQLVASEDDIIRTHEALAGKVELDELFT